MSESEGLSVSGFTSNADRRYKDSGEKTKEILSLNGIQQIVPLLHESSLLTDDAIVDEAGKIYDDIMKNFIDSTLENAVFRMTSSNHPLPSDSQALPVEGISNVFWIPANSYYVSKEKLIRKITEPAYMQGPNPT